MGGSGLAHGAWPSRHANTAASISRDRALSRRALSPPKRAYARSSASIVARRRRATLTFTISSSAHMTTTPACAMARGAAPRCVPEKQQAPGNRPRGLERSRLAIAPYIGSLLKLSGFSGRTPAKHTRTSWRRTPRAFVAIVVVSIMGILLSGSLVAGISQTGARLALGQKMYHPPRASQIGSLAPGLERSWRVPRAGAIRESYSTGSMVTTSFLDANCSW